MNEYRYLTELSERYPVLKQTENDIKASYEIIREAYENGGKLLIAGNGGSCADAEHIVGELMKISFEPSATAGTTMLNESRLPRHARHAAAAASGGAASHCIIGRKRAEHCFLQ